MYGCFSVVGVGDKLLVCSMVYVFNRCCCFLSSCGFSIRKREYYSLLWWLLCVCVCMVVYFINEVIRLSYNKTHNSSTPNAANFRKDYKHVERE